MALWHPDAKRVVYTDAGPFIRVPAKLVWHTTETKNLPAYSGSAPHFTFNPATGSLWQHVPLNRSAKALRHPYGVETNKANAIQVELLGYAKDTHLWPRSHYVRIARLARWIEKNAKVARRCTVEFESRSHPLQPQAWLDYSGHIGHQHVPYNDHWDPGRFDVKLVLSLGALTPRQKLERSLRILRAKAKAGGWKKPWRVAARKIKKELGL